MTQEEAVCRVIELLERAEIGYMLVGAYSSNAWGIPRSTKDADFVLGVTLANSGVVLDLLKTDFDIDPQASFETKTGSLRWTAFNRSPRFMIELFLLSDDPHNQQRYGRKRREFLPELEREVWVPAPEDVVIQKVRWGRDKDRSDARDVIAVSGDLLDWPYVESWCNRHGTRTLLEELRASIPPID